VLEMRPRSGRITLRGFIRALLLSHKFHNDFYRCNSNTRMVDHLVGRVLGRPVYGDQVRIALSILIAEQGLPALVNALLDSEWCGRRWRCGAPGPRARPARRQRRAPPQLEPAPAVQPKQCSATAIGAPAGSQPSRWRRWRRFWIGRASIWLKSQS